MNSNNIKVCLLVLHTVKLAGCWVRGWLFSAVCQEPAWKCTELQVCVFFCLEYAELGTDRLRISIHWFKSFNTALSVPMKAGPESILFEWDLPIAKQMFDYVFIITFILNAPSKPTNPMLGYLWCDLTLIKKKIKISSNIRKFRMEQLQRLTASPYMGKYLRISSYTRKLLLIYDFAAAPLWISLYMRKIWFSFSSV